MTARTTRRPLTDADRAQRRAEDRERLQRAASALLTSDGWQRWVRARSRNGLARYSVTNVLLVLLDKPDATYVAGFKAWLDLGYSVVKGARATHVLAPVRRHRDEDADEPGRPVAFRRVPVFDRADVRPLDGREPTPLEPPMQPLTGDSHAHLLPRLARFAKSLGYTVAFRSIAGSCGGWCDHGAKEIVVDANAPTNARVRTLTHEIAHALGVTYADYGRDQAEVLVDTITYVVLAGVGLDVSGESVAYVAGWGEDGALEAVTAFAQTIDELAKRIEAVLASG